MSITIAGSMGGLKGLSPQQNDKEFVKELFEESLSYFEFKQWFLKHHAPKIVSLVINNNCNLQCKHCYLQVKELTTRGLDLSEWKKVIDSIASMKPGLICLSGKEVFVDVNGTNLLLYLKEVRDRYNGVPRIGFITNGTLLHRHYNTIISMDPDYLDISLDGIEADHDAIRGKGAFARTMPNVYWAMKTFNTRFFISLTIQRQNVLRIIKTLDYLQQQGIRNISSAFYKPLAYTDQSLILSQAEIDQLFEDFHALSKLNVDAPVNVMLDLDISNLPSVISFVQSEWFDLDGLKEDDNGNFFLCYDFGNNLFLWFRLNLFPSGISRVRLTPEGNLLAAGDTINTATYAEHAIGNVRDFDYSFPALHNHALHSDRLEEILQEYYYNILPPLIKSRSNANVKVHCEYEIM